jgi:hypothetical protein
MKLLIRNFREDTLPEVLLFGGSLVLILWSIYFSIITISIPYQIEFREGTAQVLTSFFLRWINPFTLDSQPLAMNNYGIGYNLVVLPFAAMFGNTLIVHRSVTFVFIVLSALLGFIVVYQTSQRISYALACSAFIMIGLIARGGIGAFPSSLGFFLFFLSILVPFFRSFDLFSLFVSLIVSILAFYTKPYFVLSFGIVFSYLFFFVSRKKSIFYGLMFLYLFSLLFVKMSQWFPLYWIDVVVGNASNTSLSLEHLTSQILDLLLFFSPVLFFATLSFLLKYLRPNSRAISLKRGFNYFLRNALVWNSPLSNNKLNYLLYVFICSVLAFLFVLGPHIGSYLNYAYQLIIPTFFSWFFSTVKIGRRLGQIFVLAVLVNLFIWGGRNLNPDLLQQKNSQEWAKLFEYVHSSESILNSPVITSEIVELGNIPMDSGQTSYFYRVDPFSRNPFLRVSYNEFLRDGKQYTFLVDRMIEKQKFDMIVTTKGKSSFYHDEFTETYVQIDEITVHMPQTGQSWTLVIWKPKE